MAATELQRMIDFPPQKLFALNSRLKPRAAMHRVFSLKIEVCYLDNAAFLGCFVFSSAYHRHEAAIAIARKQIQIAPAHFSKAIAPSQRSPRFKHPLGKI